MIKLKNKIDDSIRDVIIHLQMFQWDNHKEKICDMNDHEIDIESMEIVINRQIYPYKNYSSFEKGEKIPFRLLTKNVDFVFVDLDLSKPTAEQYSTADGYIGVNDIEKNFLLFYKIKNNNNELKELVII
jgi:hypothetical protein